ncbi:MAG: zinc ribbon domain-containing protein [Promethearchaeota archaeon]
MSNSNLEMNWISFVKSLRSVGVLLLFVMIPYLAFVMIPIHFILTMVAIKDINNMNRDLNNTFLRNFRSKYLTASIVKFIGSIIVHVGAAMLAVILSIGPIIDPYGLFPFPVRILPPTIILLVIGFIVMIIGSVVEVGAWDNLKFFIQDNSKMFPERTIGDIRNAVDNLRSGALMWALGFLIIPIIIGWIFQLIGYFTLSNVAKWGIKGEPITPSVQGYQPVSTVTRTVQPVSITTPQTEPEETIRFCPMCGAKISEGAKFCGECGVHLIS